MKLTQEELNKREAELRRDYYENGGWGALFFTWQCDNCGTTHYSKPHMVECSCELVPVHVELPDL